jgi:Ser/Thr protein kinase RdoA (MazF antagonist)
MKLNASELSVLKNWDIQTYLSATIAENGLINKVIFIQLDSKIIVLKRYSSLKLDHIIYMHSIMKHVYEKGINVALPMKSKNNIEVVENGSFFYCLYNYIEGSHPLIKKMNYLDLKSLGRILSKIHTKLKDFNIKKNLNFKRDFDFHNTYVRIESFKKIIENKKKIDNCDMFALTHLDQQENWLKSNHNYRANGFCNFDSQIIHGDFQSSNILIDKKGLISGILDWDLACYAPPELELIRSIHYLFNFSIVDSYNFLKGYLENSIIKSENLINIGEYYILSEAHNLWLFEAAYVKKNERVRNCFNRRGFISSIDKWQKLLSHSLIKNLF